MRQITKSNVARFLRLSTRSCKGNYQYITYERDAVDAIIEATDVGERVVRSRETLFGEKKITRKLTSHHATPLGEELLRSLELDFGSVRRLYPQHEFSPYFNMIEKLAIEGYCRRQLNLDTVDMFNAAVERLRSSVEARAAKMKLEKLERAIRKNTASLREHQDRVFDVVSRALVIRFDLHYLRVLDQLGTGEPVVVPAEQLLADLDAFLKYLREKFPSMVTYVMSIESGVVRGTHVHFMLILDGNQVMRDITIAATVCRHWAEVITEGRGWYYNCQVNKGFYASRGILALGVIHRDNALKRDRLERTLLYFVKRDYYIRLRMPGIKKTFRKGYLPPPGRPRRLRRDRKRRDVI